MKKRILSDISICTFARIEEMKRLVMKRAHKVIVGDLSVGKVVRTSRCDAAAVGDLIRHGIVRFSDGSNNGRLELVEPVTVE